jgi:hypothetical protein
MNQEEKIKAHLQPSESQIIAAARNATEKVLQKYKHKMEYYQERDKWQNEALKWLEALNVIIVVYHSTQIDNILFHLKEMLDLINLMEDY